MQNRLSGPRGQAIFVVTEPCYIQTAMGLNKSTREDKLLRIVHIHRSAVKLGTLRSTGSDTSVVQQEEERAEAPRAYPPCNIKG